MNTGYFGQYGGMFAAQPLVVELKKIEEAFDTYYHSKEFQDELNYYMKTYTGRPTMLTHARNISKKLGGAQIYFKREDMTCIGAHKINHTIVQGLLAKRMGKKSLIAETGAGMHGVSVATVGAMLDMPVKVFMGEEDTIRQKVNVDRMRLLGAEVIPVTTGSKTLKDAVNETLKCRMGNLDTVYNLLGSSVGPHPFPSIVRESQSIVGKELKEQFKELSGNALPDYVIACVGGGCNSIGVFSAYLEHPSVKLIGVEAGGRSIKTIGQHASRIDGIGGEVGIFHGYKSYFLQQEDGNIAPTHSISAGLDYPGIGPEHAYLHDTGKATYVSASDDEVIKAFQYTAKHEGILSALESAHALAHAYAIAPTLSPETTIVVNLSGRGDKDLHTVIDYLEKQQK